MHMWGDEGVDWKGIDRAAELIGLNLRKWGRAPVLQWKEKWGMVQVYTGFGWYSIHDLLYPGYAFIQWKKGSFLWHLNYFEPFNKVFRLLNYLVVPYQKWLYRYLYKRAVKRWPHLLVEILVSADHQELLSGLGIKFSDYWTTTSYTEEDDNAKSNADI